MISRMVHLGHQSMSFPLYARKYNYLWPNLQVELYIIVMVLHVTILLKFVVDAEVVTAIKTLTRD